MSLQQQKISVKRSSNQTKNVTSLCSLLDFFALPCTQQYYLRLNENNDSDLPRSTPDNFLYLIQICKGPFTGSVNDCENIKVFFRQCVVTNVVATEWALHPLIQSVNIIARLVKTRQHSSRMHTARLETVRASISVATTRCCSGVG